EPPPASYPQSTPNCRSDQVRGGNPRIQGLSRAQGEPPSYPAVEFLVSWCLGGIQRLPLSSNLKGRRSTVRISSQEHNSPIARCLPVDVAQHDVDRAEDRDEVGDQVVLPDLGHDGQVDEARRPDLAARRNLRAVAHDVEAQLAARVLDRGIGLADGGLDLAK